MPPGSKDSFTLSAWIRCVSQNDNGKAFFITFILPFKQLYQVAIKPVIIRIVGAVSEPPLLGLRPLGQNYLYDGNFVIKRCAVRTLPKLHSPLQAGGWEAGGNPLQPPAPAV
jgi:hypothetical protein